MARPDPARLDKYELIRKLASGGMAEVWLGRVAGPAGFSKLVALKRIHPHLAGSPDFVEMFLDEARLASRLDHPNIVQILELGQAGDDYFLAMELVHGRTLREVVNRATEQGRVLPLDGVLTIALGVLSALAFAHSRRSPDGRPAPVIHRDVSPQNILISYGGNVKLGDFGIAKAQGRAHVTQEGVVKGKAYYMAPEQMFDGEVDARSDLYAMGVVLFELLTGQRAFARYHERQMFDRSVKKEVPAPSLLVPARPITIDPVVARLLEPDPERRYASSAQVITALEGIMLATRQVASPQRLASVMRVLFADEIEAEERTLALVQGPAGLAGKPTQPLRPGGPAAEPVTLIKAPLRPQPTRTEAVTDLVPRSDAILESAPTAMISPSRSAELGAPVATGGSPPAGPAAVRISRPGLVWSSLGLGAVLLAGGIAVLAGWLSDDADHEPEPEPASLEAGGPRTGPLPALDASIRTVRLRKPDLATDLSGQAGPRAAGSGLLSLSSEPSTEVYLGGRRLGRTPLQAIRLPAGSHSLRLREAALSIDLAVPVTLLAGQKLHKQVSVGTAVLRINAIPWARVILDGKMLDVTPLKPQRLYAGQHTVELVYPGAGGELRHRTRVQLRAGESRQLIHNFLKASP